MKKLFPILVLAAITGIFFYKVFLSGKIPFPGDLLLSGYGPWRHQAYGGYAAGGVPSKDQYFDVVRELYPWKTIVIDELKRGIIPLWNPYNFSGSPLLANYQSQVFYPPGIIYFILPQVTAWTILLILQPFLGSVFLYLFAVEIGLSLPAAILAAVLFNFSSFANVWMEFNTVWHTILWLPLLLYIVERGIKQRKLVFWQQICFIAGLFCAITAGHPQDFLNSFFFLVAYTVIRLFSDKNMSAREKLFFLLYPLSLVIILPFCLAAPQLFPTIELFRNSARVTHEYQQIVGKMLIQWWQMPLIMIQELFGNPATKSNLIDDYVGKTVSIGAAGFFLALVAITGNLKSRYKRFFVFVTFYILLITVNTPITQLIYRYPLPVLSTGAPNRIFFLLTLSLSLLAGFGYDTLSGTKKFPVKISAFVFSVFLLIGLLAYTHVIPPDIQNIQAALTTMKRALMVAVGVYISSVAIVYVSRRKNYLLLLFIPLCVIELLYGFIKFNPFVSRLFVFPENRIITYFKTYGGIDRFWGYGTAAVEANFATQERIFSPDGTDPLNLRWYNQFLQSSRNGIIATTFDRRTRSDAQIYPGYGELDLPGNLYRLRVLDMLGVKYIIDRAENPKSPETFPDNRYKPVLREENWIVYENLLAAPRFFVTPDVRTYTDNADFERQFYSKDFHPDKTVLIEAADAPTLPALQAGTSSAALLSYQPSKIKISVKSDSPQFLFLSDTFDTGWKVTVNSAETKLYKTNFAFRGVAVPEGESTVEFFYSPESFRAGTYVGISAFIFIGIYGIIVLIIKRHNKS